MITFCLWNWYPAQEKLLTFFSDVIFACVDAFNILLSRALKHLPSAEIQQLLAHPHDSLVVHTERSGRILGYLHFLRSDPRIPVLHSSESKAQTVFLQVSKHKFQTSALSAGLQISCSFLSSPACRPHTGDKKLIAVMQLKHSCTWKLFRLGLTDKMKSGTQQPDSPGPVRRGFTSTRQHSHTQ